MHKHFEKTERGPDFDEPHGAKLYPHVATAVYRTPDLISSVTWFRSRQAIMVSPNNLAAIKGREAFTRYDHLSGTGWVLLDKDKKPRAFQVSSEPIPNQTAKGLTVHFTRELPREVRHEIRYVALETGEVAVFSRWTALRDLEIKELVDHPFRWVEIEYFLAAPEVKQASPGVWNIGGALQLQVLNGTGGEVVRDGINGLVRRKVSAKAGEVIADTVGVYQPLVAGRQVTEASILENALHLGKIVIDYGNDGALTIFDAKPNNTSPEK